MENLPAIVAASGQRAGETFLEFFFATIRNKNTRAAYARAVIQFLDYLEMRNVNDLMQIRPLMVAAYIEQHPSSKQTVKQHLAAIRMLFDYLVANHVLETNPAQSVKGPKFSYTRGKTSVLTAKEARQLLDSIDVSTKLGLRDRALMGVMVFSFARISAVLGMKVSDYYVEGKRSFLRLNEKGGKQHNVPVHHNAEAYLDEYIAAWGLKDEPKESLWLTKSCNRLTRIDAWAMVKRRAKKAGLSTKCSNHTFRATGITTYLENNGTLEKAQQIAAHASTRTTKLYDRRDDQLSLDEIERIQI
jgi:site-specific recombinase XerD